MDLLPSFLPPHLLLSLLSLSLSLLILQLQRRGRKKLCGSRLVAPFSLYSKVLFALGITIMGDVGNGTWREAGREDDDDDGGREGQCESKSMTSRIQSARPPAKSCDDKPLSKH